MSSFRPRLFINLDEVGKIGPLNPEVAYEFQGRVCTIDPVGCVLCVEDLNSSTLVSREDDGSELLVCLVHGPLVEVQYEMIKKYTVTIGGVVREVLTSTPKALQVASFVDAG